MSLENKRTGTPPTPREELEQRAEKKERELESTLLKKSLAESIQQTADEYTTLNKKFEQLMTEYNNLLLQEEKSRNSWQEQINKKVSELQSLNSQLQCSIDQKIEDMGGDLERRTIEKVEEVAKRLMQTAEREQNSIQKTAAAFREEIQAARRNISSEYRTAFGVGVGWKILMGAGSVAWVLVLLLHYVFKVA